MVLSLSFSKKLMKRNKSSHTKGNNKSSSSTTLLSDVVVPTTSDVVELELFTDINSSDDDDDSSNASSTVLLDADVDDDTNMFDKSQSTWGTTSSSSMMSTTTITSPKRSVSFALYLNLEYNNLVMCKEELTSLWYNTNEYMLFRSMALDAAQQIITTEKRNRAPHSYQRVIERTYHACCTYNTTNMNPDDDNDDDMPPVPTIVDSDSGEESDSSILSKSTAASSPQRVISDDDMVHLQRWLEVGSSRLGLEKWSIKAISSARSARREMIIDMILSVQQQQRSKAKHFPSYKVLKKFQKQNQGQFQSVTYNDSIWSTNSTSQNNATDHDMILRLTCERVSRPSTLFSHVMAQGLAAAVAKEQQCH